VCLLELDVRGELVASLDGSHCEFFLVLVGWIECCCCCCGIGGDEKKEGSRREGRYGS
jgi:hypothetical protein